MTIEALNNELIEALKSDKGTWAIAVWGGFVSKCPSAPEILLYLSILLAVLQIIATAKHLITRKPGDRRKATAIGSKTNADS